MILRLLIYAIIFAVIYYGIRKILAEWRAKFQEIDKNTRQRDMRERARPDVVDLKPDEDGVFRPGDDKKDSD